MTEDLEKHKRAIWREFEKECDLPISNSARVAIEQGALGGVDNKDGLACLAGYLKDSTALTAYIKYISESKNRQSNKSTESRKKRYEKPFKRRLYLVSFVSQRVKNLKRITRDERERICREWNKLNPSDIMNPNVLRVEYQRAKKDLDVDREYFDRQYPQYGPQVIELASFAKDTDWASDRIREALGSTALHKGELAVASTVQVTRALIENQPASATEGEY